MITHTEGQARKIGGASMDRSSTLVIGRGAMGWSCGGPQNALFSGRRKGVENRPIDPTRDLSGAAESINIDMLL